jgi:phosphoenolpyruvate-protein kinase (PTS system EI component)
LDSLSKDGLALSENRGCLSDSENPVNKTLGVGIMVMAPVIQLMIDSVGWRFAFLLLSVGTFTIT